MLWCISLAKCRDQATGAPLSAKEESSKSCILHLTVSPFPLHNPMDIPTFLTFLICCALGFWYYSSPSHFSTLFMHRICFPLFSAIQRGDAILPNTLPATSYCLMPHRTLLGGICAAAAWKIFMFPPARLLFSLSHHL